MGVRQASIFVDDLTLPARLGVYPAEQGVEQTIRLSIEVGVDTMEGAVDSGRLADTLDYEQVANAARTVVARGHYPLVETLAHAIALQVLRDAPASWVRVRLAKLGCLPDSSAAGADVTVDVERAGEHLRPLAAESPRAREDVVILGGGVAGLSAALWAHRLGYDPLVIDGAERLGGQLHLVHRPMIDLPAMVPMTGAALAGRLVRQFAANGGRWLGRQVVTTRADRDRITITLGEPERELATRVLIVATGVRRRTLGIEGEQRLQGRGLLDTAAIDVDRLERRHVLVVGGGDSACENALLLTEAGARVTLVHRGASLSARSQFVDPARQSPAIELRLQTHARAFVGDGVLEAVVLEGPQGRRELPVDAALVRVGWQPNNEALPREWLGARGYLAVDPEGRVVAQQNVVGAGEIIGPLCPSVAVSMGSGAAAARAGCMLLERS